MAAPPPAAGEGEAKPPGDDLADLTMYINKTTDESLESTRRMVALAEASKEAGKSKVHYGQKLKSTQTK